MIYHFLNPFNVFDLTFETVSILVTVVVALVLSFAVYRPFCQFVCPVDAIKYKSVFGKKTEKTRD